MTIDKCLRILKLGAARSSDELHRAYRRQVKLWHPDQFAHQPAIHAQAEERLKQINIAYATLKDHIEKTLSNKETAPKSRDFKPDRSDAPRKHKSNGTFRWSRWFRPRHATNRPPNEKRDTANRARGYEKASFVRKRPNFQKVLRETAGDPKGTFQEKYTTGSPLDHPHLYRNRKKGLRINGFRRTTPISPVRPVSKINKIE